MKVSEFALKNNFSNVDKGIVEKLHGNEEKTEYEWFNLFDGHINFDSTSYITEMKKKEKIEKIKTEKQSESKK